MLRLMGKKRKAPTKAKAWMRMQAAELADNNIYEKIKDKFLDDIPSPYLNGMLDKFFDGRLSPFI